jgi:hypothetical protein
MYEPGADELNAVIFASDLAEKLLEFKTQVNDPLLGIEIEPLKLYCQKTGHIIGQRDENSLFSLIKFKGKDAIVQTLYNSVSLNCHPAWVETNGKDLDCLIDNDPIGYAVYCFGLITAQFYQNSKNTDRKRQPWCERYWAMARANALLTQRGIGELAELNIELCKLLTYAPDTMQYLFKRARKFAQTPDQLALLACTGELTPLLKQCVNRALDYIGQTDTYITKTRFVDYANTPADAARGPSNIRQQKASKKNVVEAGMYAELMRGFESAVPGFKKTILENTPGTGAWREKFRSNTAAKEAEMMADYAAFGGTNFDLGLNDDVEDNAVEVRELVIDPQGLYKSQGKTWKETTAMSEAPQAHIEPEYTEEQSKRQEAILDSIDAGGMPILQQQKPMTPLEKMRAARGLK